ncbi:hypothetical protein Thal_1056 [Thermocrinis albus DSM 14484]|uniref:Uncharacterized protein n=1 Tax=Thermocrinis albus (strain DSM 14484 / JCM 11386 / HI 11/12) TaxID=638303 RepID=D3SLQ8_THEAH|nr:hypothetical protein [Thermocrinis albus]ADC89688.1 hypothetical protein Thal_1056 [Thermocrinis albus DSM 14484]
MAREKELKQESLEDQVEELRKEVFRLLEIFLPPKELRSEIMHHLYSMELSFLKIFKTLLDYQISHVERKLERTQKKEKVKRIEVE